MDDEHARDGLGHLQAAARELIAAARTVLDIVEDLVDDPAVAATFVGALGAAVRTAARAAGVTGDDDDTPTDGDARRVERIQVS
jgi:hypothetical protein